MRLENVLAVTGGKLLCEPAISRFDNITPHAKKATRGSLFIAMNPDEIPMALQAGTYGVLTDATVVPTDREIAWIHVENLVPVLPKLLRLWLMVHPRRIFEVSRPHIEYIERIGRDNKIVTLQGDETAMSLKIFDSAHWQTIFCADTSFLEHIGVHPQKPPCQRPEASIVSSTIFETSLIVKEHYYERLSLIAPMVDILLEAAGYLDALALSWSLSNLDYTASLQPIFVDHEGRQKDFGESDRVLVFATPHLPCRCYEHFKNARWSHVSFFKAKNIKFLCDINPLQNISTTDHGIDADLVKILCRSLKRPGYLVLIGVDKNGILYRLAQYDRKRNHTKKGLF